MNISIACPTWYQMALAAVEGTEKDQTELKRISPYKKFTYHVSLRLKLSKNAEITEYSNVSSHSCCTANIRRKALQERAILLIFFYSCQPDSERIKRRNRERRGVPVVAQQKRIQLVSMRMQVLFQASLSGSGSQCCQELWCVCRS